MTTFHDLARRADGLETVPLDVDALIARGEQRLRRRRLAAVAAAAVAVVVIVAGGVLLDSGARQANAPIDQPNKHDKVPDGPPASSPRKIVYADGIPGRTMHFGSRVVQTGSGFEHIDMTDDGFVYTSGGYGGSRRLWFSDGGTPRLIATRVCRDAHGSGTAVRTANAGSLVAWFECAESPQTLVVLDTSTGGEVVRQQLTACVGKDYEGCTLDAVIGEHVYFTSLSYRHGGTGRAVSRKLMFDVSTRLTSTPTARSYPEDVTTHSRGLVIGDSWSTGTATGGIDQNFAVVGSTLVPQVRDSNGELATTASFEAATRREVRLDMPAGYHRADGFTLFEWLDDDTVALVALGDGGWPSGRGYGDILTCRLSTGHCELTVRGQDGRQDNQARVVPHLGLPG
jgi:hypothetical protein